MYLRALVFFKKLENKTRLTCRQFYNLLLLLISFKNLELNNNQ